MGRCRLVEVKTFRPKHVLLWLKSQQNTAAGTVSAYLPPVMGSGKTINTGQALYPPSTVKIDPVMKPAFSLAKKATAAAISAGVP